MTFDPSTLAGKVLWLRAKDNAGADGSSVTSWADQSGAGGVVASSGTAPTVATASTPLGGKSVRFGGAGHFTLDILNRYTASSVNASAIASWGPQNAFDGIAGDSGNSWASIAGFPQWLQIQCVAQVSTGYAITARTGAADQAPNAWTFLGSNDGSSWTTLDTQTAQVFTAGQTKTYTFTNSTAYAYYRINVTAVNSSTVAAIAELAITGVTNTGATGEVWVVVKADSATATNGPWAFSVEADPATQSPWYSIGGVVYENFGASPGSRQSFTPTLSIASWRIYRVVANGTAWAAYLDGVSQATATTTGPMWRPDKTLGINAYGTRLTGNIAEILVRTQVSTTQEVSDITAYLTAEHFVAPPAQGALRRPTIVASRAAQRASRW